MSALREVKSGWRNVHIVAYRPVAKQWPRKQQHLLGNARNIHAGNNRISVFSMSFAPRPLLCNGPVNTPLQHRGAVFSAWSMPRYYLEDNWRYSSVEGSGAEYQPAGNVMTTEAEESPLLRFVTRKCLVKTLQRNSHCWELLLSNG
jgi:hypothetical protein